MQKYNFACCFVWVRNLVSHMQRGTWWEGTLWRSCFRHCTASRKVAGSIPEGVIGMFR